MELLVRWHFICCVTPVLGVISNPLSQERRKKIGCFKLNTQTWTSVLKFGGGGSVKGYFYCLLQVSSLKQNDAWSTCIESTNRGNLPLSALNSHCFLLQVHFTHEPLYTAIQRKKQLLRCRQPTVNQLPLSLSGLRLLGNWIIWTGNSATEIVTFPFV